MSCCDPVTTATAIDGSCSACGTKGVQVDVITAKALMTPAALRRGFPEAPRFCPSAACSVVYFDDLSDRRVEESELTVPVYAKHPEVPNMLVCYCFDYSVGDVKAATHQQQTARVSEQVRAEVEAGRCACEVKNPRGACCLGDIIRIERAIEGTINGKTKTG